MKTILAVLVNYGLEQVSYLEQVVAGLPVVSTFHAGIPDLILDGETGLLVPEHDVDAMAEKMLVLLENQALAQ